MSQRMPRRYRWIIRLGLAFAVLGVALAAAVYFSFDTLLRDVLEKRITAATGMKTTIGSVRVGWTTGAVTIRDFRLYNPPAFGGAECLDIPEFFIQTSPDRLQNNQIHLKTVRLDLARIVVVQDKKGRSNFGALENKSPPATTSTNAAVPPAGSSIAKFPYIDTLELSLGTLQIRNLANGHAEEIPFNIKDQVLHNVKSPADIAVLGVAMALEGGGSQHGGVNLSTLLNFLK